jgi:DNA-3-methyladenine glycosylase I
MKPRCNWLIDDPTLIAYHDEEWGVPELNDRALWESLMLSGFQAGLSWLTILHKRGAFRKSFEGFHPEKVARYREEDIARLMNDASIIRSRSKISATIAGAQCFLDMQERGEDFSDFVWGFVDFEQIENHGPMPTQSEISVQLSEALKDRGFKFVGPVIVYAWMQSVGMVNDHTAQCFRRKDVQSSTKYPLHIQHA